MIRLLCCLLLSTTAFAATLDTSLIPADRQWIAHLDVHRFFAGSIGTYIQEHLTDPQVKKQIDGMILVTGVDPTKHIATITLAGIDDDASQALCWVRGTFDPARITQLAELSDNHRAIAYGTYTVHQWVDRSNGQNKPQAGCLVRPDLLIFGQTPEIVEVGIDVLTGARPALAADAPLLASLPDLESPFLVAAASGIDGWKGRRARSALAKQVRAIGISATETADRLVLSGQAQTTDAATATQLKDLGQGMLALTAFNEDLQKLPVVSEALKTIQLQANGETINASVSCTLETLRAAAEQHQLSK